MGTHAPNKERGQALIPISLALTVLLLAGGLSFDAGALYLEKRRIQVAADAAAQGAAYELMRGNTDFVTDAALTDARFNGYDTNDPSVTVTVNHPPANGMAVGDNDFVEVTIRRQIPTTFMRIAGPESSTVVARAVAGRQLDPAPPCVLALNPTADGALTFSGTSDLIVPTCSVQANSNSPQAIVTNGGACVVAKSIGYVPEAGYLTNGHACLSPPPTGNAIAIPDPYGYVAEPDTDSYPVRSNKKLVINGDDDKDLGEGGTLLPGYYKGGIQINGGNITLLPGLYLVDGLTVNGNVTLSGDGVTIYNTGGGNRNIDIGGGANVQLSAPRGGEFKNLIFFNSRSATQHPVYYGKITGTEDSLVEGVVYFPTTHLRYAGNALQSDVWSMIIADTLELTGTSHVGVTNWDLGGRTPGTYRVAVVE